MALGGGSFTTTNKILPGSYINFVSSAKAASNLSDRGVIALPIELDWGADDEVFSVTQEEFLKYAMKHFGYAYNHAKMKGIRDLFKNIKVGYFYKLMNTGVAAANTFATAKYKGIRGNDLKTVVAVNVDNAAMMDVSTYLGTTLVDKQTVLPNTDNLAVNDYCTWNPGVTLTETAGLAFTTGSNGTAVTGAQYQAALDAFESYSFNAIGCLSTTPAISDLMIAYTKRLREQVGVKFQAVVYQRPTADHEGIISVENTVSDSGELESSMVFWTLGAAAGVAINASNTNKLYDGEFEVVTDFTQTALETAIKAGKFMFHKVNGAVRVLTDINTLITLTPDKGADFQSNQTVRVLDQIGNDIALLFNTRYLGKVPNDAAGRISLWNDIVKHHQELENIRAIENFSASDVTVRESDSKKEVVVSDKVTVVNAMEQLYMTVVVQ